MDEPVNPGATDLDDYGSYNHIYTNNLEEVRTVVLSEFQQLIKDFGEQDGFPRVNMLEAYLGVQDLIKFYDVSDFCFNFNLLNPHTPFTAQDIKNEIDNIVDNLPAELVQNWVVSTVKLTSLSIR